MFADGISLIILKMIRFQKWGGGDGPHTPAVVVVGHRGVSEEIAAWQKLEWQTGAESKEMGLLALIAEAGSAAFGAAQSAFWGSSIGRPICLPSLMLYWYICKIKI